MRVLKRCGASAALFLSLFLFPWWVTALIGFALFFFFDGFVEFFLFSTAAAVAYANFPGARFLFFSVPIGAFLLSRAGFAVRKRVR